MKPVFGDLKTGFADNKPVFANRKTSFTDLETDFADLKTGLWLWLWLKSGFEISKNRFVISKKTGKDILLFQNNSGNILMR